MRHPIAPKFGHAEIQRARIRIARLDDGCIRKSEITARGPNINRLHFGWWSRKLQAERDSSSAMVGMAVAAVGVQVTARPGLQRLCLVIRVGDVLFSCRSSGVKGQQEF